MHIVRTSALTLIALASCATPNAPPANQTPTEAPVDRALAAPSKPATWMLKVSGTTLDIEFASLPAGPNASAFSLATREIPWEVYDAFVFGLDEPTPGASDAVTRPSHPYITMDRGFGHAGYPVISVSFHGAQEFCRWLSQKSGKKIRMPTDAEWEYACRAGAADTATATNASNATEIGASAKDTPPLADRAWFRDNAQAKTHPCGAKAPNAWGLHDMLGNAAEWCTSADGKGVLCGGSFRDAADAVTCSARKPADPAWNRSDPQLPRGIWWLADGPFAGFRVLCESNNAGSSASR